MGKKTKLTVSEIHAILKEYENGKTVEQISIDHKIPKPTFYGWKQQYGNGKKPKVVAPDGRKVKELEEEVRRLKRMYAELSLEHGMLKDTLKG